MPAHRSPDTLLAQLTGETDDPALLAIQEWATRTSPPSALPSLETLDEEPSLATAPTAELPRYEDRGFLARGGMGELRRVHDRRLDRVVVQKILRSTEERRVRRFWVEATVTAHLEHPGIIPVHDFGTTDDGAPFFTMKEVRGETWGHRIQRLRTCSLVAWGRTPDGLSLRTAIDELRRFAHAVAFAHEQGILHRDLKPDNLMVGSFGEALVLDWGIALVDPRGWSLPLPALDREGQISGTPSYMAPEQAWGQLSAQGPWTDAWSLGAILFHLLVGHPPLRGTGEELLVQLRELTQPPELPPRRGPPAPWALEALCRRCLEPEPSRRIQDAASVAAALGDWLDGDRREEEANTLVERARGLLPRVAVERGRAADHQERARRMGGALKSWTPVAEKRAVWEEEDRARRALTNAEELEGELVHLLRTALERAPEHDAAHRLLADHFQAVQEAALERGDVREAAAAEAQLRRHDRGAHRAWLEGRSWLSLATEPAGVEVAFDRLEERERRLQPVETGLRARTPLERIELPAGSWLLRLRPGPDEVRLPILLRRAEHHRHEGPQPASPALRLPAPGDLCPDEVFVPAGFSLVGDIEERGGQPRRRLWVPSFVIARHPVTNAEYLEFLNDLQAQGREAQAEEHRPRLPAHEGASPFMLVDGRYTLVADPHGDTWDERAPVLCLRLRDALAFAEWRASRDGLPWRLPWEVEWERAARGADGRRFPWGDYPEPTWSRGAGSRPGRNLPGPVGDPPEDLSPFGVHGLAGNARCWTLDAWEEDGSGNSAAISQAEGPAPGRWHITKGGHWAGNLSLGAAAARYAQPDDQRINLVGMRLCRSWP